MGCYHDQLVNIRRQLHEYPEEGWSEFTTTAFLVKTLRGYGYDVLMGTKVINPNECLGRDPKVVEDGIARAKANGVSQELLDEMGGYTGCVAILKTGRPGPTLAVRFDIDGLPVTESTSPEHKPAKEGFASRHQGFMHACGHDSHMSVGLAVAHWAMDHKDELNGTLKILFQPAEEGVRGAAAMAASGILDDADYFLSSHCSMNAKSGELCTNLYGFLCTTKYDAVIHGKQAHAGLAPQQGHNALAAAANATVQMLGIPRHADGMTRVNIGQLTAGEGRNVIPSKAVMKLEVRGETAAINDYMSEQVLNILKGIEIGFQVKCDVTKMGAAMDLHSDKELTDKLNEAGAKVPGLKVVTDPINFGGSEDATILARRVQSHGGKAAFFLWGSTRPATGHHTPLFDICESDMDSALAVWENVIPSILK